MKYVLCKNKKYLILWYWLNFTYTNFMLFLFDYWCKKKSVGNINEFLAVKWQNNINIFRKIKDRLQCVKMNYTIYCLYLYKFFIFKLIIYVYIKPYIYIKNFKKIVFLSFYRIRSYFTPVQLNSEPLNFTNLSCLLIYGVHTVYILSV